MLKNKLQKGFTLIELLVVIGILGILLAIVLIAINPAAQFAQANNTARTNDVNTILNAIHQYGADHKGLLTALNIPSGTMPANGAVLSGAEVSTAGANMCALLSPNYVSLFPVDPDIDNTTGASGASNGAAVANCAQVGGYFTGYYAVKDSTGRITVWAPHAESVRGTTPTISVTR
ncbi:MAG TPA: type II secretion system protein [Patescibacteria group bacterium]|nr:type II secretion system protein [Patescibacteria group bacterium]